MSVLDSKWSCKCGETWSPNKTCPLCGMTRGSMLRLKLEARWAAEDAAQQEKDREAKRLERRRFARRRWAWTS
jgi:hypothetical protein